MNYLTAQDAIQARLSAKLPASIPVKTAIDASVMQDQKSGNPEIWVLFHRDQVSDHSGNRTLVDQQWAVVYVTPGLLPDMARDGGVLSAATKALANYDAEIEGLGTFKRVGSMVPQSWAGTGLVAYGMLFSVSLDL